MKPVIIIAIFGITIVMAMGLLMIEIPTERIVSDIDKPTINPIPEQKELLSFHLKNVLELPDVSQEL